MKNVYEESEKSGRKCEFGKNKSIVNKTHDSNNTKNTENTVSRIFRKISLFTIAIALFLFILSIAVSSVFAVQDLMALQGNVNDNGLPITTGNLTVTIWTEATGGSLIYNSSSDYNNAITAGKFDVMLGDGTQELVLEYGTKYYMDMSVNDQDLDFNGTERRIFQSNTGNVSGQYLVSGTVNTTQISDSAITNQKISASASIDKSKISLTGTWAEADIPSLTNTWAGTLNASRIVSSNLLNVNSSVYATNAIYATNATNSEYCTYIGAFDAAAITAMNDSINGLPNGNITGTGTTGYVSMWNNGSLINSHIYINSLYGVGGINAPVNTTNAASWGVYSELLTGDGVITVISYDNINDETLVMTNGSFIQIDDASTIIVNSNIYFVNLVINATHALLRGNVSFADNSVYETKLAPYIDILGSSNEERGISISDSDTGQWHWAMYVPDDSNNSRLCFGSAVNPTGDLMCLDDNGDVEVIGTLRATSVVYPRFIGIQNDSAALPVSNGDGTATIPSNIVNCFDDNLYSGVLRQYTVPSATLAMTAGVNTANYIYVECSLNPIYKVTTDRNIIDNLENVLVAKIMYTAVGSPFHIEVQPVYGTGLPGRTYNRIVDTQQYALSEHSTLTLGVSDLNVTLTPLTVWAGNTQYNVPAIVNTSTRGFFIYHTAGAWNISSKAGSAYNNTVFDNGTDLQAYTPGYYGVIEVYRGVEVGDHIYFITHNQEYSNLELAQADQNIPITPAIIYDHAIYVGRIIFEAYNSSNVYTFGYRSGSFFSSGGAITTHNSLTNLDGGASGNYYHLGMSDYNNIVNQIWLNTTDQRYNDTAYCSALASTKVNTSSLVSLVGNWSNDKPGYYNTTQVDTFIDNKLNYTDQRFNETSAINTVNSTVQLLTYTPYTGLISGGRLAINSDTSLVNVSAGTSLYASNFNDTPIIEVLSWNAVVIDPSLAGYRSKWIGIERVSPGVGQVILSTEFTQAQKRVITVLGRVIGNGSSTITSANQYSTTAYNSEKTLEDLMFALGSVSIEGNVFTPSVDGNMLLGRSAGKSFRFSAGYNNNPLSPNIEESTLKTNITSYQYHIQNRTYTETHTQIDPDYWDNAGVKTSVPAGNWTIQRIYYFPFTGNVHIIYGQALFDSKTDALASINNLEILNKAILDGAILRGWMILQSGATNLGDTAQSVVVASRNLADPGSTTTGAGGSGGVSVHSQLLDLEWSAAGHTFNSAGTFDIGNYNFSTTGIITGNMPALDNETLARIGNDSLKLNITDQRYNDTAAINAKVTPASCSVGTVVQNTTTSGVQCVSASGITPVGSSGAIQYNNNSLMTASTNAIITSEGFLNILNTSTNPSTPTSGATLFTESIGNYSYLGLMVPGGRPVYLQPSIRDDDTSWCTPPHSGVAATAMQCTGMTMGTTVGTVSNPAPIGTNFLSQLTRSRLNSSGTANSGAEYKGAQLNWWRGNATGLGGFLFAWKGAWSVVPANGRGCVGMFGTIAALPVNADCHTANNSIYAGFRTGNTTLQICSNDNVANATCPVDCGGNFPAGLSGTTAVYLVNIYTQKNGAGYWVNVQRQDTQVPDCNAFLTTDIPANSQFLTWHVFCNNGGTAAQCFVDTTKVYIGKDN